MISILGIIPARMGSTRFPGKPLAAIHNKPMIQWVWERCQQSNQVKNWVVATDHDEIYNQVVQFGGKAIMTSPHHQSGTDRCIEAFEKSEFNCTHFINVQGDEPLIAAQQIDALAQSLKEGKTAIATLIKKNKSWEDFQNKNRVKVVIDGAGKALYFSRSPIPFQEKDNFSFFWKHIGMYGFDANILHLIQSLSISSLEKQESLEQLRWLENGIPIQTTETELETPSVDTPEDLADILMQFPQ
jgi:3-deoxy-manno-octulosonate cytidylyltransferase (CMP-KDO synthetase)